MKKQMDIRKTIRISSDEEDRLNIAMRHLGYRNQSEFIRIAINEGVCVAPPKYISDLWGDHAKVVDELERHIKNRTRTILGLNPSKKEVVVARSRFEKKLREEAVDLKRCYVLFDSVIVRLNRKLERLEAQIEWEQEKLDMIYSRQE